jgi:hypothetical protein
MLIGYIDVFNKIKVPDLKKWYNDAPDYLSIDNGAICNVLQKHFSQTQLEMIECAFEGGKIHNLHKVDGTPLISEVMEQKCAKFYDKYEDSRKRLAAIMRNMIKNNGIFKP